MAGPLAGRPHNGGMRISARADYAVRAVLELAVRQDGGDPVKAESIAAEQDIPHKFLEGILGDLRRGGIVDSRRGGGGGYRLARDPAAITVADVIRAVDGPIVSVRGERPTGLTYTGSAQPCCRCGSRCGPTCAASWRASRSRTSRRTRCRSR